ncbi:methyltransferase family protein [Promicromonospora citrea]|uniref:Protein-S-isoprenylcysteine O-methyltransferase Ste14 n=1 Tax=Promicromonospora citrea TaxID=43677 RepID=A0A8H9L3D7_9MICO|nr:isoprenylcysteine carboxylmethyltransferase family protein [Promicromonospora citrea]NNH52644.1 isoprenylcysteine carboxylmethyltransferase family protein [Promicromonospora citrea]GGM26328.1 hypothetical protein GCM10010102_22500 [Promicromonospora citrea]
MTAGLDAAAAVVRGAGLGAPLLAVVVLCAWRPPGPRVVAAAITSTAWAALLLLALHHAAVERGWWTYHATGAVWRGLPVDLWLGWSLLWGAVPALCLAAARHDRVDRGASCRQVAVVLAGLVVLDLVLMPYGAPVVVLGSAWLVGEVVGVLTALVPAVLLARWTLRRTRVTARAWAQAVWAGGLLVGLPVLAVSPVPPWPAAVTSAGLQLALVACLPGLAAMRELAVVGRGTPLPYDPPARLVTSGPYAYVRNPMQLTVAATFAVLAPVLGEPELLVGVLVAVAYSVGIADWHEGEGLRRAFGRAWTEYRAAVRPWVPRLRPAPVVAPATLWVAADCEPCTGVALWFARRRPVGLTIRPAAEHPEVLWRVTYELTAEASPPPGSRDVRPLLRTQGVSAVARALAHVHLGWALAGWALDLPGVRHLAQLGADAFGAEPRPSRPVPTSCPAPRLTMNT